MKLTEEDVKFQYVEPNLLNNGWNKKQIRKEHYFTDGKIHVFGKKIATEKGKNDYKIFNKLTNFQDLEGELHAIFIHFIL